jgi:hypothetical protein
MKPGVGAIVHFHMPMPLAARVDPQAQTPAPAVPAGDLASLRGQLASLEAQRAGLQTEAAAVNQQLKSDKGSFATNVDQAKASEVALQIAHIDGDIARIHSQIAAGQGEQTSGTTQTPPYNGIDPDIFFAGAVVTLAFPVVIALSIVMVRRFARGGRSIGSDTAEVVGRLDRLEQAVDTIAVEVERISEGQRYVTKILSDQPARAALAGDPTRDREKVR